MIRVEAGQQWVHVESGKAVTVDSVKGDAVTITGMHWPYWLLDVFLNRFAFEPNWLKDY